MNEARGQIFFSSAGGEGCKTKLAPLSKTTKAKR